MTPENPAEATQFDLHIILVSLITALTIGKILTSPPAKASRGGSGRSGGCTGSGWAVS